MAEPENAAVLRAAAAGDQKAWESIVDRYANLVWSVARSFQLGTSDAADISQATWLRLIEHIDDVRDADKLGSWLATTARREALALLRRGGRDVPAGAATDFVGIIGGTLTGGTAGEDEEPDAGVLRDERDAALWHEFRTLSEPCQQLLRVLIADPPPSYAEVSAALDVPVGSIGPTRQRCLGTLRRRLGST
ncbi:sigma-70 family RNA polymerase sigma factor [Dactylosporangium sp. NBC_01737]|uniref:RNA polymerase sigma factor n=1 Tax=Dactylosporangium sp. NBC_01737 TaxID=2975959 RepID=UPI002E0F00A5|nr:sigma-70 family RNA polymerase sigma factor [Dactylosporangium sp. NBC_01737]